MPKSNNRHFNPANKCLLTPVQRFSGEFCDFRQVLLVPDDFFGLRDIDLQVTVIDAECGRFVLAKASRHGESARRSEFPSHG